MNEPVPFKPKMSDFLHVEINDEGAVVEDQSKDRVHYLNTSAAYILGLCDGETAAEAIASHLQAKLELSNPPTELVGQVLRRFASEGLIT
jgi:methyltransferase-like protein